MTAVWPATLPPPLGDAEIRLGDGLARDAAQHGLHHYRRRTTDAPAVARCRFHLDGAGAQAMRVFFAVDLGYGAAWFAADWLAHLGYPHHQARFVKPPAYRSLDGALWECEAEIEIRDAGFADDAGRPSPHHDPTVQGGPVSSFEGKQYRFYDDLSTFQGWTLEAGSAPTHDPAAGTLTVPAGTRISKPLNLDFSDYAAGKLVARMQVNSNGMGYSWGYPYPTMYGKFGVFVADDAGNGYGILFDRPSYYGYAVCARLDAWAWTTLAQTSRDIHTDTIPSMTIELALTGGEAFAMLSYSVIRMYVAATDATHKTALRVGIQCFSKHCIAQWLEVEFS